MVAAVQAASVHGLIVNVFMDSRTRPEEFEVLRIAGLRYRVARNVEGFVPEGIYPDMCRQLDSEWVWILNSDEWPSFELVRDAKAAVEQAPARVVCFGFARKWVRVGRSGNVEYSRLLRMSKGDYQWRIVRHKAVTFVPRVHSPGFCFDESQAVKLPKPSIVFHFDWVVHSFEMRKRKLEVYEEMRQGSLRRFRDYYLPERREWLHFFTDVNSDWVTAVARRMARATSDRGWPDDIS